MSVPLTTHQNAKSHGAMVMRVNREFSPEVARRLETIQEPDLAFLLDQLAEDKGSDFELTEEQIQGVKEAERSLVAGRTLPPGEVEAWLESWGTDHELPMPKCK